MCSTIGVGERLHKVLGQFDPGTLDSGERSLPFGLLVSVFHDLGMNFKSNKEKAKLIYAACKVNTVEWSEEL